MSAAATVVIAATIVLIVVVGLCIVLAIMTARRLVLPHPRHEIPVLAYDGRTITVPASRQTLHPGIFGIWAKHGSDHLMVGDIVSTTRRAVTRAILKPPREVLHAGEPVTWTSHVFSGPEELSSTFRNIDLHVPDGIAPAWLIPAETTTTSWAIHIHGIRTTRITALRSVPAALAAGMTSLVISYRGDGEGPTTPGQASMLGSTEWEDLEAAVKYALGHGAERIILIAWSMGAEVALNYLTRNTRDEPVSGTVLIAPITDWTATLTSALRRARLPNFLASAAARILASPKLHRLAGTTATIRFHDLDWTRSAPIAIPALVVHSQDDTEAPIEASRRFAHLNRDHVTLVETRGADHALEYNLNSNSFTNTVSIWLVQLTNRPPSESA